MSHSSQQNIDLAPGFPAVAAIPPVTGQAPATPGSSLTANRADAAGEIGYASTHFDATKDAWRFRCPQCGAAVPDYFDHVDRDCSVDGEA